MSSSAFRQKIVDAILKTYNGSTQGKKLGEAARSILQSAKVQQCVVLTPSVLEQIKVGYNAAANNTLKGGQVAQYKNGLIAFISSKASKFPGNTTGGEQFQKLVKQNGLTFGLNIFYVPKSFDTIIKYFRTYNETFAASKGHTYDHTAYGQTVHIDHGGEGVPSGLMGAVLGLETMRGRRAPEELTKKGGLFDQNLTAALDAGLNKLTVGQKGKTKALIMEMVANAHQFVDRNGELRAGFSMLLSPVLQKQNSLQSSEEKQTMDALVDAYRATMKKVEYEKMEGSSTLLEKVEKVIVIDKIVGNLKSKKNLKVKLGAKKVETKTRSKGKGKTKGGKGVTPNKISRGGVLAKAASSPQVKKPKANRSLFNTMAMINQKLPDTVRKNMRAPRLVNQSGAFASSVKITDVMTTKKGYPSFGYTYDKNPYQVYEVGTGAPPWATPQRDPRTLIDASIREIAANLALGRFYTRRM
tara:strand:+ start:2036 stop:3445 length:1410 start_codon:yes stop_codon:yes gene_type:complete